MLPKKLTIKLESKLVIIFLVYLSIVLLVLIYLKLNYSIERIPIEINVEKNVAGFNVETSALYFGTVPRKGVASRNIAITSDKDVKVTIRVRDIPFVYPVENNFVVKKGGKKAVDIVANVSENIQYGYYKGELVIISKGI